MDSPTSVSMTVVMGVTMKLRVRLHEYSGGLERLELRHEKYKERRYDGWY
jgi:hypothetical protein